MTIKSRTDLKATIDTDIPDNTIGSVSAEDVRENMKDSVDSAIFPEDVRPDIVYIRELDDFPTPAAGVITLADNSVYSISGIIDCLTNRIVMGDNTRLAGEQASVDGLTYSGTNPFITAVAGKKIDLLDMSIVVTSSADMLAYNGSAPFDPVMDLMLIDRCLIIAQNGGTLDELSFIGINSSQLAFSASGFVFANNIGSVRSELTSFIGTGSSGALLDLDGAIIDTFRLSATTFVVPSGMTGIDASSSTINVAGTINSCGASGAGTFVSNIDCTTPEWDISQSIEGFVDTKVGGGYTMEGNATVTTIAGLNTWTKLAGTTIVGVNNCQFSMSDNNELTYNGIGTFTGTLITTFDLKKTSGSAVDYDATIFQDGTKLANILKSVNIDTASKSLTLVVPISIDATETLDIRIQQTSGSIHSPLNTNLQLSIS